MRPMMLHPVKPVMARNRRSRQVTSLLCFLFVFLFPSMLFGVESGSISVLVFEDGQPLADCEVVLDSDRYSKTDRDGSVKLIVSQGTHRVEIIAKNADGRYLGYFKQRIGVKNGKNTQVIATFLSGEDNLIAIDTPLDGKEEQTVYSPAKGYLSGTVVDAETERPILNARIFVKGTAIDGRTDDHGHFKLQVPADVVLTVSIIHPQYASRTLDLLQVNKDGELTRDIVLNPAGVELEEFVVLAPKIQGAIATIVREEKESVSIANILGSDEMSKKGDSSAAGALQRVTGVTLVDGKNAYVRGLGDRYSNIEMNSMPIPSPNPLKRAVPLDIFPAGAIGSMKVQKSATADIPAGFGGGYIDIRTKDASHDNFFKVSVGVKGNSNTGEHVNSYSGGSSDWLGFDDGYREIDADILGHSQVVVGERVTGLTTDNFTKEELSQFAGGYLSRDYSVVKKKQPIGASLGVEGARDFELTSRHRFAFFGFYTYDTESSSRTEEYHSYDMQKETGRLYREPAQSGTIDKSMTEYVHNAMINLGYTYAGLLRMKYTKLYTHNADDVTLVADGVMGSNNEDMTKYYLNWEERTLNVDQISGAFDYELFGAETNFSFGFEWATARLYQPNNYQYTYRNEGEPFLDNKISNNIANKLESNDDLVAGYLRNRFHFDLLSSSDYLEIGMAMNAKDRQSRQNKFFLKKQGANSIVDDHDMTGDIEGIYDTYVRADIAYDNRSLVVGQLFKPADHYDAEVDETSVYFNTFCKPATAVEVLLGARYVDYSQVVYQYVEDRNNPDMSLRRLIARAPEELNVNQVYPSFGVKYSYDEKNIFDLGLSQTYITPDLREFTSGEYFHPYEVATIVGNPELVNTDIYSFDLKYGHYFSEIQAIKFGLFYKYLDNPIEDVLLPSSSLPIYSFDNAAQATVYGLEIDGRKDWSFISDDWKDFYLSGNLSLIKSEVTLTEEVETVYSTNHRELQGLSPVVINLSLGYDVKQRSVIVSYNKMGERIRKVGMIDDGDSYPDHYEDPAAMVDLVWIEHFRHGLKLKAKVGNILRDETVWTQGDRVTKRFQEPMTFSVGLSYEM